MAEETRCSFSCIHFCEFKKVKIDHNGRPIYGVCITPFSQDPTPITDWELTKDLECSMLEPEDD